MPQANEWDQHYRTLEIDSGATMSEIRTAYRLLVKTWHPDRYVDDEAMRIKAEGRLREINIAFEALKRVAAEQAAKPKPPERPRQNYPVTPEPPPAYETWRPEATTAQEYPSPRQTQFGFSFSDRFGRTVIHGPFGSAEEFSEGLAVVGTSRVASMSKFGYIGVNGEVRIPYQFDAATGFRDGRAAVRIRNAWGFIDNSGRMVIPARFQMAQPFSEGYAAVREQGLWGYVDRQGQMVVAAKFASAKPFQNGWAVVSVGNRLAKVNARGEVMLFDARYSP